MSDDTDRRRRFAPSSVVVLRPHAMYCVMHLAILPPVICEYASRRVESSRFVVEIAVVFAVQYLL